MRQSQAGSRRRCRCGTVTGDRGPETQTGGFGRLPRGALSAQPPWAPGPTYKQIERAIIVHDHAWARQRSLDCVTLSGGGMCAARLRRQDQFLILAGIPEAAQRRIHNLTRLQSTKSSKGTKRSRRMRRPVCGKRFSVGKSVCREWGGVAWTVLQVVGTAGRAPAAPVSETRHPSPGCTASGGHRGSPQDRNRPVAHTEIKTAKHQRWAIEQRRARFETSLHL